MSKYNANHGQRRSAKFRIHMPQLTFDEFFVELVRIGERDGYDIAIGVLKKAQEQYDLKQSEVDFIESILSAKAEGD